MMTNAGSKKMQLFLIGLGLMSVIIPLMSVVQHYIAVIVQGASTSSYLSENERKISPDLKRLVLTESQHSQDVSETPDQCFMNATPWIKVKTFPETYLVFYMRRVTIRVLQNVAISRRWKWKVIHTSSRAQSELQELVSPERFLVVITFPKVYNQMIINTLANSTNALIGHLGNYLEVLGTKKAQLTSFRSLFQSYGCSLEDTGMMPRSFVMDDQNECREFFTYSRTQQNSYWLHKPSRGVKGKGISIHSNLTFFYKEYASCSVTNGSSFIIQEYIANLLLLNNRKFDIRTYILVAKTFPHYLVFYHEGYLRVTMKEFDINGSIEVHLTNSAVQAKTKGYVSDDHLWSFERLQTYFDEHRPQDGRNFVSNTLVPFIKKTGALIANAVKPVVSRAPSNYVILGLDFMVTSELSVKFIELNFDPLWTRGTAFIDHMIPQMANDMFDLLLDCCRYPQRFQDMHQGEMYKTWTLAWNEHYDQCSSSTLYNSCKDFIP